MIPKISVILPFYNCERFLSEAIQSVLDQTLTDFELILINDASTDQSAEIAKGYLVDPRVRYFENEKNQGIVYSLNQALALAQAELVARMDGDDICERSRFAEQFAFLEKNQDIVAVGSFVKIIDETGKEIDYRTKPTDPDLILKNLISYSPLVHPAVMFRKSVILALGGYRDKYPYPYLEDIDLWYRLGFSGYRLANLPKFLLKYRYQKKSTVAKNSIANALVGFRLRRDTIKTFNLKLSGRQRILIYLQLIVGVVFSSRQRQFLEGFYKVLFYHGK